MVSFNRPSHCREGDDVLIGGDGRGYLFSPTVVVLAYTAIWFVGQRSEAILGSC
jgi:hypothetical protein